MDRGGQGSWGGCTLFCPWIRAVSVPYLGRGSGEVDHREQTTLLTINSSRVILLVLYVSKIFFCVNLVHLKIVV